VIGGRVHGVALRRDAAASLAGLVAHFGSASGIQPSRLQRPLRNKIYDAFQPNLST
jgi:hypothetical protein